MKPGVKEPTPTLKPTLNPKKHHTIAQLILLSYREN
jgi:hypothetical protein